MASDDACGLTGLELGLNYSSKKLDLHRDQAIKDHKEKSEKEKTLLLKYDHVLPSLSLGSTAFLGDQEPTPVHTSSASPGSSYSNSSTVKRERGGGFVGEDVEFDKAVSSRASDEDEEGSCPRKKLRLTKEQSAVLEDSFKLHSTLNPTQKQALARQLNLRPRQVEVWFQNRRARTKLKQTEMDCELLKKCCESLTEENKRLHRELQELRNLKLPSTSSSAAAAVCMQMPAATLFICPSCEKINNTRVEAPPKVGPAGLAAGPNKGQRICSPFARPSAAC